MSEWASDKKDKIIFENWRKFVNEEVEAPAPEGGGEKEAGLEALPKDFSRYEVEDVVRFLNSPEGKDPKVRALLGAGTLDAAGPADEKINVDRNATPTASSLAPTQNEISLMKSIGFPLSTLGSVTNSTTGDITGKGMKIVTSGDLVIDGHHRWSSTWATAGKGVKISAVDIAFPGAGPLNKLAVAQVAIVAAMPPDAGNVPKATAGGEEEDAAASDNILGKDAATIKQMILDREGQPTEVGILLGPEYLQKIVQVPAAQELWGLKPGMTPEQTKEQIATVVSNNLADLPDSAGPKRDYMPQFDGGETHTGQVSMGDVIDKMETGGVNYKASYKPVKKVAEALRRAARLLENAQYRHKNKKDK